MLLTYMAKGRSDRNTNISSSFQLVSVIYSTLGSRGYVIAFNQSSFFGKRLFHFMTKARCSGYLWHDSVHAHNLQAPRNHLLPLNFLSLQIFDTPFEDRLDNPHHTLLAIFTSTSENKSPKVKHALNIKKLWLLRLLYSCPKWPGGFLEVSQKTSFRQSATLLFLVLLPFGKSNRQKSLWLKISNPTNTHKWTGKVSERRKTFQLGGNTFRIHNCLFPHIPALALVPEMILESNREKKSLFPKESRRRYYIALVLYRQL